MLPVLLTLNLQPSTAFAQGTAFSYQGKLNNGTNVANGNYDLAFALYATTSGGGAVAGPLTNSATVVTNGLFSVTLDFGSNAFNGSLLWLEIGVRTNGSATAFTTLSPRQQLMPVPYALYAMTPAGPTGPQGPLGLTGATGPQGPTGIGATGPQGVQGIQGPLGTTGAQGVQGIEGPPGPTGPTGPQGVQGIQGPAGNGTNGATGPQGPQGIPGTAGATGATGPRGVQGIQGPTGLTGAIGEQGVQGIRGLPGTNGVLSLNGLNNEVTLAAGPNVTLTTNGNVLQVSTTGTINFIPHMQVFDSSGTFVVPAGVSNIMIEIWGGGGGGGGSYIETDTDDFGGGGGGGGYGKGVFNVNPGASYAVIVGLGGLPGNLGSPGGQGGTSSFGFLISAVGGFPGTVFNFMYPSATGGVGGSSDALINITGGSGIGAGFGRVADGGNAGCGGSGGRGDVRYGADSGQVPGGGGGGGLVHADPTGMYAIPDPGASGAHGRVVVYY